MTTALFVRDPHPELKRWVDPHAEPDFLAQFDWLHALVDSAQGLDDAERARVSDLFGRALTLAIDFPEVPTGASSTADGYRHGYNRMSQTMRVAPVIDPFGSVGPPLDRVAMN